MKTLLLTILLAVSIGLPSALSQQNDEPQDVKQKFAQLKQTVADNRAKLRNYQWLETTEVSIKGDTKKDEQKACHYGPDGQVQKTRLGAEPTQKDLPGGLRGKMAKKKITEMQDYMTRLKGLISHYAPPDPEKLQVSFNAGKAVMSASSTGVASLTFSDYYKPGDKVTFGFDTAASKLTNYDVNSYLDDQKDVVTLTNQFATLPDNTNYLEQTVLTSKSKEIEIKTTNSNYGPYQ